MQDSDWEKFLTTPGEGVVSSTQKFTGKMAEQEDAVELISLASDFLPAEELNIWIETGAEPSSRMRIAKDLRAAGHLLTREDVWTCLQNTPRRDELRIRHLLMPTRNRPLAVRRSLAAFSKMWSLTGREVTVIIADDSDAAQAEETRAEAFAAAMLPGIAAVWYLSPSARAELADKLAASAGVAPELAHWLLCGGHPTQKESGAVRNCLLLLGAGLPAVYSDDDILPGGAVTGGKKALSFSQSRERMEYYPDLDESLAGMDWEQVDDFAEFETSLMGNFANVDGPQTLHLDGLNWQMAKAIRDGICMPTITAVGFAGADSKPSPHLLPVLSKAPRGKVEHWLQARHVRYYYPERYSARGYYWCTAYFSCCSENTPVPWFPIGRGQDTLLAGCWMLEDPAFSFVYEPWAVRHCPLDMRKNTPLPELKLKMTEVQASSYPIWLAELLQDDMANLQPGRRQSLEWFCVLSGKTHAQIIDESIELRRRRIESWFEFFHYHQHREAYADGRLKFFRQWQDNVAGWMELSNAAWAEKIQGPCGAGTTWEEGHQLIHRFTDAIEIWPCLCEAAVNLRNSNALGLEIFTQDYAQENL